MCVCLTVFRICNTSINLDFQVTISTDRVSVRHAVQFAIVVMKKCPFDAALTCFPPDWTVQDMNKTVRLGEMVGLGIFQSEEQDKIRMFKEHHNLLRLTDADFDG